MAEATAIISTGVLDKNLNLHPDEQNKDKEIPMDLRDKLLKTINLFFTESQDENSVTCFADLTKYLFAEFNSSRTIRIDYVKLYEAIHEVRIYEPEHSAEDCDPSRPVYVSYDEESRVWQVSTVGFTFRGLIIYSPNEDVIIHETFIANDKTSDSSKNFQNLRLPPPTLHFSECSTQVNSLSAVECSAHDKYPMLLVNTSKNGEEKCKNQLRRKRKNQMSSSKNVSLPWQMPHSGLSRLSREAFQHSRPFLLSTLRQFRRLYHSCLRFWTPFLMGNGMRLSGIFLFSSRLLDASTLYRKETNSLSSFIGGISN